MFNQGGFNQSRFNVHADAFINGKWVAVAKTFMDLTPGVTVSPSVNAIQTTFTRIRVTTPGVFQSMANAFTTLQGLRDVGATVRIMANTLATFDGIVLTVQQIEYTGDFSPGDVIEINTERMTVTINGTNALKFTDGEFPKLSPGENYLRYIDSEGTREVVLKVIYRERHH